MGVSFSPNWTSAKGTIRYQCGQRKSRIQRSLHRLGYLNFSAFLRMPFGLRNAGQSFQRFLDDVLQGLDFVFVYVDDILIASWSEEEHILHVQEVLRRLGEHGLVINAEKCS